MFVSRVCRAQPTGGGLQSRPSQTFALGWKPRRRVHEGGLMLLARPLQAVRTHRPLVSCVPASAVGRTRPTRVTALDHRRLSPGPPHPGHTQTLAREDSARESGGTVQPISEAAPSPGQGSPGLQTVSGKLALPMLSARDQGTGPGVPPSAYPCRWHPARHPHLQGQRAPPCVKVSRSGPQGESTIWENPIWGGIGGFWLL